MAVWPVAFAMNFDEFRALHIALSMGSAAQLV